MEIDRKIRIKENSWFAYLAAKKLGAKNGLAIVFGRTIYLHRTTTQAFLADEKWVRHELCHVLQFKQYGWLPFVVLYIWHSIKSGYYNNKFEVAAREAENKAETTIKLGEINKRENYSLVL